MMARIARPFKLLDAGAAWPVVVLGALLAACASSPRAGLPSTWNGASAVHADTLRPVRVPDVQFDDARAIASDPLGFLYVADAGRDVVVKFRPSGAAEALLGGPGSREGEFDEPSGIDPTNGLVLFVADAGNHRIQKFSRSNAYLGSIPLTSVGEAGLSSRVTYRRNDGDGDGFATGRPLAVVSSDAKDLYAIDSDRNVIFKWDENLRLAAAIGDVAAGRGALTQPVDLALGPQSAIYVADRGRRAIVVFDAFGSVRRIIGEGRLAQLRAVAIGPGGLYAGHDTALSVYDLDGGILHTYHLDLDAPLVDLAVNGVNLFLLTSERVYVWTF